MIEEIKFFCGKCESKLSADSEHFGTKINCPVCNQLLVIPDPRISSNVSNEIKPLAGSYNDFARLRPPISTQKNKPGVKTTLSEKSDTDFIPENSRQKKLSTKFTAGQKEFHGRKRTYPFFPLFFTISVIIGLFAGWWLFRQEEPKKPQADLPEKAPLKYPEKTSSDIETLSPVSVENEKLSPRYHYVFLEGENADKILPSFEIDNDSACSGGKYLIIREGSGSGWTKPPSGRGSAEYNFDITASGIYYLWARVKWESGCSDAFYVHIDDDQVLPENRPGFTQKGQPETLGKDTTFHVWHWYCRHVFNLKQGKHKLTLKNQDDGSRIDLFILSDNPDFVPHGFGKNIVDFNSGNWVFQANDWKVHEQKNTREFIKASHNLSILRTRRCNELKKDSGLHGSFEVNNCNDFRIVFAYLNEKTFAFVEKQNGTYRIVSVLEGQEQNLQSVEIKNPGQIKHLELALDANEIDFMVNYQKSFHYL